MWITHWCFSALAIITALVACYLWYRASAVNISPGFEIESGEIEQTNVAWTIGNMQAFLESGRLNKQAALWTGASVVLSAIASAI